MQTIEEKWVDRFSKRLEMRRRVLRRPGTVLANAHRSAVNHQVLVAGFIGHTAKQVSPQSRR